MSPGVWTHPEPLLHGGLGPGATETTTGHAPVRGAVGAVTRVSVTIVSRTGEDVQRGYGGLCPGAPWGRGSHTVVGEGNQACTGQCQVTDPPTVPFQTAHQSLALLFLNSCPCLCTAGERALGAPNVGFTLGLWKQTGLGLRLLASSCVTSGK